jgi:hypothetical protein
MQVNSAQDYLTARKRQIIAATFHSRPAPQQRRTNAAFISAEANGATLRERFILPTPRAWGSVPGTATYTSRCCLTTTGAPFALGIVTDGGVVRFNVIPPLSVTATRRSVA